MKNLRNFIIFKFNPSIFKRIILKRLKEINGKCYKFCCIFFLKKKKEKKKEKRVEIILKKKNKRKEVEILFKNG